MQRHDIDTDVGGARAFFEIEKALGIRASYYFRLSTIDRDLMREINSYGSEVGYHYEELATHAKRYGLNTPAVARAHMDAITAELSATSALWSNRSASRSSPSPRTGTLQIAE